MGTRCLEFVGVNRFGVEFIWSSRGSGCCSSRCILVFIFPPTNSLSGSTQILYVFKLSHLAFLDYLHPVESGSMQLMQASVAASHGLLHWFLAGANKIGTWGGRYEGMTVKLLFCDRAKTEDGRIWVFLEDIQLHCHRCKNSLVAKFALKCRRGHDTVRYWNQLNGLHLR